MANVKYFVESPYNIKLLDCYKYSKKEYDPQLNRIMGLHPTCEVWKRSRRSLKKEWATHSALYKLGLWKNRTKDVDLNFPLKWYAKIGYAIFGTVVWPFLG